MELYLSVDLNLDFQISFVPYLSLRLTKITKKVKEKQLSDTDLKEANLRL